MWKIRGQLGRVGSSAGRKVLLAGLAAVRMLVAELWGLEAFVVWGLLDHAAIWEVKKTSESKL